MRSAGASNIRFICRLQSMITALESISRRSECNIIARHLNAVLRRVFNAICVSSMPDTSLWLSARRSPPRQQRLRHTKIQGCTLLIPPFCASLRLYLPADSPRRRIQYHYTLDTLQRSLLSGIRYQPPCILGIYRLRPSTFPRLLCVRLPPRLADADSTPCRQTCSNGPSRSIKRISPCNLPV